MTRRHFEDLADRLIDLHGYGHIRGSKFKPLYKEMVSFCKTHGQNFDEGRFRFRVEEGIREYYSGAGDELPI